MANERLRDALLRNGLDLEHVAIATGVDPKTVERWITKGRTPYPRHRHTIASMVQESANYLWPEALPPDRRAEIGASEVVKLYPHRQAVPNELWDSLIAGTQRHVSILLYSGTFLTYNRSLIKTFKSKAEAGVKIRLLLGDPASRAVAVRSNEEGIGKDTLAAKVSAALLFFSPLAEVPGVEIKCHATTLYNSIYRFDDDMLVNTHVYGFMAAHAPTLHLRQLYGGDLFDVYSESFETVWNGAKPPKWPT